MENGGKPNFSPIGHLVEIVSPPELVAAIVEPAEAIVRKYRGARF